MTFSKKKNINTKYNSGVALTAVPLVNRKMTEKKRADRKITSMDTQVLSRKVIDDQEGLQKKATLSRSRTIYGDKNS